jgi:hypothetical protein
VAHDRMIVGNQDSHSLCLFGNGGNPFSLSEKYMHRTAAWPSPENENFS